MEDVIIYNESWNIDKLSPYNTFYMEGSIIDGLKRLWQAFLNMLKRIKQRLQYMFNSDARIYRKVVQGLKIPSVVADWKETRCTKRDYSVLKELLAKGIELCDCILSIKDVFENVEVVDGHATWTPSEISKLGNNNKDIIKINGELKTITTKKQQAPVENGQTVYDLATEWVEIYELTVRYLMRHDKVIEFTKEMDKIVKSLPENQATVTSKLMQNWITGLSYLHNVEGPAGPTINARVDSRDGFVQIKTMLDENSKLLEKALKTTREASAEAEEAIKDSENFMRNNKNLLKKYAPWKEYYTEGMTDMDTIIYKDDQPENDGEITTESANEEPTIDEVNAYIEYAMNDLHDAMELRNRLIQESDDDTVEDFEESDTTDETPDDVEECGDGCKPTTEYYSDAIIRNYNEPIQENKTYCLKSNDMFTTESYDEPSSPNRFYQETDPSLEVAAKATKGVLKWAGIGINTGVTIAVSVKTIAVIKVIDSVATSLTYNKKLGRFPSDIKRTMDILKNSKDGTSDISQLAKALKDVKSETRALSGRGVISYKATKNATYTERDELKKLYHITEDLLNMLSKKPDKAAARRVSARIEDFVVQAEKVMKLLNRGKNPGDVVKEYMS
jgi:hypothetical protein